MRKARLVITAVTVGRLSPSLPHRFLERHTLSAARLIRGSQERWPYRVERS
jgi:hypothetical protein